jgi:hypothetical protein
MAVCTVSMLITYGGGPLTSWQGHTECLKPQKRISTCVCVCVRSLDGRTDMFVPELNKTLALEVQLYRRTTLILTVPFLSQCRSVRCFWMFECLLGYRVPAIPG